MPLYEYVAREDGTTIELLRPMRDADAPVMDPENKGRTFVRASSTFATGGAAKSQGAAWSSGGCCPCGKQSGSCGSA
jgi:hypothetical protein